jgi:hypothetical protein
MRDSEQEYPLHQPEREEDEERPRGRHHHFAPLPDLEDEDEQQRRRRMHQREVPVRPELPRGRLLRSLIVGIIAGILCSVQDITIVLLNASTFNQASQLAQNNPYQLAIAVTSLCGLRILIGLLICCIAGFVVGKLAVHRRLGFLAGFLAGVVYYGGAIFLPRYIPHFPGNIASSSGATAGGMLAGVIISVIFAVLLGLLEGLASLLGAWIATRRHPYYVGYSG